MSTRSTYTFVIISAMVFLLSFSNVFAGGPYTDHGNGTITDQQTALMWQQSVDAEEKNHADAYQYCADLELGGHSDWRLPESGELTGLWIEENSTTYHCFIDPLFECYTGYYMSNTSCGAGITDVGFGTKSTYCVNILQADYVRCVRDASCTLPTINTFAGPPEAIDPGETTTLTWSISDADSAAIDQGVGSVDAVSGSIDVSPGQTTTYTLSATNACGTVQASVRVIIGQSKILTPAVYQLLLSDATAQQLSYPMIYAASDSNSYIDRISIANGATDRFPSAGIANPYGICVADSSKKIYWTDYGTNTIQRSDFDGGNLEVLVSTGLSVPCGIAVDETNQKMYWTDWGNHTIKRSDTDGSNIEELLSSPQIDGPVGISLDIANGYFYFADENTGKIQRADLDGGNLADIVTNQATPHGIVYSPTLQKLFWTNFLEATGSVRCSDPDGSNLAVLVAGVDSPMGITIDTINDQLYYSHSGEIRSCNFDGSGDAFRFSANHVPFIVFVQQ